jgi:serine/threonine-protein kinase
MADKIKAVFLAALDLSAEQRPAYLDQACQGDVAVRRRVEAMLRAHETPDRVLDRPVWQPRIEQDEPPTTLVESFCPGHGVPADGPTESAGRVRLLGEIARGGMGCVLRGHDPEMQRELAVKVILPEHRDNPELLRRFVGEARLAGQLQHPGIMPVYDLGQMADGRPFFAMKLIRGRTLTDLLGERPEPGHDLPRWLRYFEAVCQAVGYAHAQGVIHRDLKPLNVMVGPFGEVQVMDWGLAKRLAEDSEEAGEQTPLSVASLSSTPIPTPLTRPGAIVGTPGYLAPEQAHGLSGDQRSDVFGLGAILCEILTGKPPFRGPGLLGLLEQTGDADLADATERLDRCGADADLVRLAKDCLAAEPANRPADGSAVAARLAEYQAGVQQRLRQAEVGQARAEARAEGERARRRLAVGLAAAVLAVVALGGGSLLLVQRHQAEQGREQARRQQSAESALVRAVELKELGRHEEALAMLEPVLQRLDERDGRVCDDVRQGVADLKLVGRLEKVRLRAVTWIGRSWEWARADREYEEEFRAVGLGGPDDPAETVAGRVRVSGVRAALVAALDDWSMIAANRQRRDWARAVARSAEEGNDWSRRIRANWDDPVALAKIAREAPVARLSPRLLDLLAQALGADQEAVPLLRKAQLQYPGDFWLNFDLGARLWNDKRHEEAVGFYRAALAARPGNTAVLGTLANAMWMLGQKDECIAYYKKTIELEPKLPIAQTNLGNALKATGKLDEALACFKKAVEVDPNYAYAQTSLGTALWDKGRQEEAIACYKKAIAVDPKDAAGHTLLGAALYNTGKADEALAAFRECLRHHPNSAYAHDWAAFILLGRGDASGARPFAEKAVALGPKSAQAHWNLGRALMGVGDPEGAIAAHQKAVELDPKHGAAGKDLAKARRLLEAREKVVAFRKGAHVPASNEERIEMVGWCRLDKLHHTATCLYADAFAADAKLADDLGAGHRDNAACCAALAAAGRGEDAAGLDEKERARLREQALGWLCADLALHSKRLHSGKPADRAAVQSALRHWQKDADLAGLRDKDALDRLPAPEQKAFAQLWADVAALLK